ncbi:MAG: hypothetical protein QG670_2476 [Thermoproteota archaeon]|nr:hypothetical protein [Thermoproteota archaeon]
MVKRLKLLAMDIGSGTQDILLYDSEKNIENCIKMVLPTPSQIFASKVREATRLFQNLFIKGDTIGGGAFASALLKHIKNGLRVFMTEDAAYTVRNNLDEVKQLGIEIVTQPPEAFQGRTLILEEVNLTTLESILAPFGEKLNVDAVAVAVQDHGVSPKGTSNRQNRIQKMQEFLKKDAYLENLAFTGDKVPADFLRMKSAVQAANRQMPRTEIVIMDTSPAAMLGCLQDPDVEKAHQVMAVNVGNGHTMAAIVKDGRILAVMEHHTSLLNAEKLEHLLSDFTKGRLSDKDVFDDGGHGLFYLQRPAGLSELEKIAVTGPKRSLLAQTSLPIHFAAPAGDMMMTGCVGLIEVTKRKLSL